MHEIYLYSLDGRLINRLQYHATAMEIINNQLYLLSGESESEFLILDMKTNSRIRNWNLKNEIGSDLKVGQEKIYFTFRSSDCIHLYSKTGTKIQSFGNDDPEREDRKLLGEFDKPVGITVDEKYLYVCDYFNNRVQVLDKDKGNPIDCWEKGKRPFSQPQSIYLHETLLYIGDTWGIQLFPTDLGQKRICIQSIGTYGSHQGEFSYVSGLCIVNEKLYIVDQFNKRIQVWN